MRRLIQGAAQRVTASPASVLQSYSVPLATTVRWMNVNRSTQTRWDVDNQAVSSKRTDYDFDKEQWMKQMKFASMDCIMDPDIHPIRYNSLGGLKKALRRWLTMRKLSERRPDFHMEQLKILFKEFKALTYARNNVEEVNRKLQRLTTHSEAARICKDVEARMNDDFSQRSWKAIKMTTSTTKKTPKGPPGASPQSGGSGTTAPAKKKDDYNAGYEIEIDKFELVTCYMGQMSQEDWLQITMKCEFRERIHHNNEAFRPSSTTATTTASENSSTTASTDSSSATSNKATTAADGDGWVKVVEYPVFEVRLSDGVRTLNNHPFIVVGVMRKDGTRYGKDSQDAASLRKQFDRSASWF